MDGWIGWDGMELGTFLSAYLERAFSSKLLFILSVNLGSNLPCHAMHPSLIPYYLDHP